jgi:hypothetical protein
MAKSAGRIRHSATDAIAERVSKIGGTTLH